MYQCLAQILCYDLLNFYRDYIYIDFDFLLSDICIEIAINKNYLFFKGFLNWF